MPDIISVCTDAVCNTGRMRVGVHDATECEGDDVEQSEYVEGDRGGHDGL